MHHIAMLDDLRFFGPSFAFQTRNSNLETRNHVAFGLSFTGNELPALENYQKNHQPQPIFLCPNPPASEPFAAQEIAPEDFSPGNPPSCLSYFKTLDFAVATI